ncbi:MAG: hypothetical protein ACXAEU_02625 [Candidatus Hodarchaeales archaeon]|jgi:hypothetical protein
MATSLFITDQKGKLVSASYITCTLLLIFLSQDGDFSWFFTTEASDNTALFTNIFSLISIAGLLTTGFFVLDVAGNLDRTMISFLSKVFSPYPNASYNQVRNFLFLEKTRDKLYGSFFFLLEVVFFAIWYVWSQTPINTIITILYLVGLTVLLYNVFNSARDYKLQLYIIWRHAILSNLRDKDTTLEDVYNSMRVQDWVRAKNLLDSFDYVNTYNNLKELKSVINLYNEKLATLTEHEKKLQNPSSWNMDYEYTKYQELSEIQINLTKIDMHNTSIHLKNEIGKFLPWLDRVGITYLERSGFRFRDKLLLSGMILPVISKKIRERKLKPLDLINVKKFIDLVSSYAELFYGINKVLSDEINKLSDGGQSSFVKDRKTAEHWIGVGGGSINRNYYNILNKIAYEIFRSKPITSTLRILALTGHYDEETLEKFVLLFFSEKILLTDSDWEELRKISLYIGNREKLVLIS